MKTNYKSKGVKGNGEIVFVSCRKQCTKRKTRKYSKKIIKGFSKEEKERVRKENYDLLLAVKTLIGSVNVLE